MFCPHGKESWCWWRAALAEGKTPLSHKEENLYCMRFLMRSCNSSRPCTLILPVQSYYVNVWRVELKIWTSLCMGDCGRKCPRISMLDYELTLHVKLPSWIIISRRETFTSFHPLASPSHTTVLTCSNTKKMSQGEARQEWGTPQGRRESWKKQMVMVATVQVRSNGNAVLEITKNLWRLYLHYMFKLLLLLQLLTNVNPVCFSGKRNF